MPNFSKNSIEKLLTCDLRLVEIFKKVVKNYDCTILVGYRNEKDQNAAYKSGNSKKKYPTGKHNSSPSKAVDVSPYPIPKKWGSGDRNEYEKFKYFAHYVLGVANGLGYKLRWGGDWDMDWDTRDQNFNDLVHFEIFGD